jgi:hypothetical protein
MARSHARILSSIWLDGDWRALSDKAQWLYMLALSQANLSLCGVTSYTPRRWATLAGNATPAIVIKAASELVSRRFVVIDEDAEELWIRTFIKHDGVLLKPNITVAMTRAFGAIQSETIREQLLDSLGEGFKASSGDQWKRFHKLFTERFEEQFPEPLDEQCRDGCGKGSGNKPESRAEPPPLKLLASVLRSSSSAPLANGSPIAGSEIGAKPAETEEEDLIHQALRILAERRLAATTATVNHRVAWIRATIGSLESEHAERLADFDPGGISMGWTATDLADWLEPTVTRRLKPIDGRDATTAAGRAIASRSDMPACETCGQRGGNGWVDSPGSDGVERCPACAVVPA